MPDPLRDVIEDIRRKLSADVYKNEEHVRLSLVARIVQALGWDIWNPVEVNTEFKPVPEEDHTRVDMALFARDGYPSVLIEIKAVGKIEGNLPAIETQVRDYSRNITAPFSIITDGRLWRFYYVKGDGTFAQKLFDKIDLINMSSSSTTEKMEAYLQKTAIRNGQAEEIAKRKLNVTQKQVAMANSFTEAEGLTRREPFPSLPDAIIEVMSRKGFDVNRQEAVAYIGSRGQVSHQAPQAHSLGIGVDQSGIVKQRPDKQPDKMTHKQMLLEVILVLQQHGGRLSNDRVIKEVFKRQTILFSQDYYQGLTSTGVVRWENMIGWKFTDARKLGLLKPWEESGQGICELTDKGWSFK